MQLSGYLSGSFFPGEQLPEGLMGLQMNLKMFPGIVAVTISTKII